MNNSLMPTYSRLPVAFNSGENCWLFSDDGTRYLDALSGIAVCNVGHANPTIAKAICEQAGRLVHTSNLYEVPLQAKLAERLCQLSGLDKVFFGNSGAEANEAAIKICRRYAHERGIKNPLIVVMEGSFHGRTMATLSATANEKIKQGFSPLLDGFIRIPYNLPGALEGLAEAENAVVAVMLEPIQGEGGVVVPAPEYLSEIREICDRHDWLMVLDEVQTGMCRTGEWFAWQHGAAKPDVMTLSKSLGNGLPIGACLANEKAAEAMTPGSHASTFGGNPLASRAALAVIEYMESNGLAERASTLGKSMLSLFEKELGGLDEVVDIRGKGLMLGIELDQDCTELVQLALEKQLLINVTAGKVVRLLPPLTINEEQLELIVSSVSDLIKTYISR